MSVHSISRLPLELLTTICSHLSRQDQRAIRLVSHLFNTAAQTTLFRIIFLKLNLRSFQRLQEIAQHEVLSKHARTICFDPRQLREPAWSVGFDYWSDHIAGTGMSVYSNNAVEDLMHSYEPEALHGYFLGYRNFIEGFKSLVSRGKWADILFSSIQNLPGLLQIYYTEGTYHNPQWLVTDLHDGLERIEPDPNLAKEIFAVPSLPSSYDTGFWRLLKLISGTNSASNITKISGLDLDSQTWMQSSTELKGILGKFPKLQDLALTFENTDAIYQEDYTNLPGIIATATNLRSLSLRIRYGHDPDNSHFHRRSLGLTDLIQSQWPHLQRLELYGIIIKEKDLRELITDHAPTLLYLKLSHAEIQPTSFPRRYKRRIWTRVLSSLVQSTRLECVIFDSISTAMAGNENVARYWHAAGVRARSSHKYPEGEFFVRVFRDGGYRDVGCGGEGEGEDDDGAALEVGEMGDEEVQGGGGGVVGDWVFGDRAGHF